MNRIQKLLFGAVAFAAMAGPALAETPELEPCRTGSKAVTLVLTCRRPAAAGPPAAPVPARWSPSCPMTRRWGMGR
jgi:hypothetical protein